MPVGDDERRRVQPAGHQVAAELEPRLVALARAEREPEQHLSARERDPPGHQHALGRRVVGVKLQVEPVEEQVDEVVLVELAAAPAPVALAGVLEDARDRRARADRLVEALLEHRLHVAHRQPAQERRDHERLERMRVTPSPSTRLSKPSLDASRTLGRSSSSVPLVVLTLRGS